MSFNAGPLTDPVDPRAVKAFASVQKAQRPPKSAINIFALVFIAVVGTIVLSTSLIAFLGGAFYAVSRGTVPSSSFVILAVLIGVILSVIVYLTWLGAKKRRIARYRLSQFASANN